MTDIPELKPCPFCGGTDIWPTPHKNPFGLVCGGCGSEGPPESYVDPDEAITAWNTRTPPQVKPLVWQRNGNHWAGGHGYVVRKFGSEFTLTVQNQFDRKFPTVDAAKAAAQADYTRRTLDALA